MENSDILSVMAPMMEQQTLAVLYSQLYSEPRLREILDKIIKSNDYWYERSMYLVGKILQWRSQVDWKNTYYTLEKIKGNGRKMMNRYDLALDSLDSLIITEEAYGPLILNEERLEEYLERTSDLNVFQYLIEKNNGEYEYSLLEVLHNHLRDKHREIVDYILSNIPAGQEKMNMTVYLDYAIADGRLSVFKRLLEYANEETDMDEVLEGTLEEDNIEIYQYILANFPDIHDSPQQVIDYDAINIFKSSFHEQEMNDVEIQVLLRFAARRGSIKIVKYLDPLTALNWKDNILELLELPSTRISSIYYTDIIKYGLDHIRPGVDLNSLLIAAVNYSNIFLIILADPRSHPESNLRRLVSAISATVGRNDIANALILDPRIKTEDMEPGVASSIFNYLKSSIIGQGYMRGSSIGGRFITFDGDILEGTDAYTLILRQIVLKRPTADELLDWMIDLQSRDISEAAGSVLNSDMAYSEEVAPIRALLLSMLYPEMSLEESINYLKEEGYSVNACSKSGGLLGAYYSLKKR